jgi:Ala-tRNA(Pro) deacylase
MSIATRLQWYLGKTHADYEEVRHAHTGSSREAAVQAHVREEQVAKCVLLEDERGYVNALLPANRFVSLKRIRDELDRELEFATESEIGEIFFDCDIGAIPGMSEPYGIPTIVDQTLLDQTDVYFESGDHETLLHMSHSEFARMMSESRAIRFAVAG